MRAQKRGRGYRICLSLQESKESKDPQEPNQPIPLNQSKRVCVDEGEISIKEEMKRKWQAEEKQCKNLRAWRALRNGRSWTADDFSI